MGKSYNKNDFINKLSSKHNNSIILISEYAKTSSLAMFKCNICGHIWEIIAGFLLRNCSCPNCIENKRKSEMFNTVKNTVSENGYTLISQEYTSAKTKLQMICDKGHNLEMTWSSFMSGRRCNECAKISRREKLKKSFNEIKEFINKQGYEVISKKYINDCTKLDLKCPKGHLCEITWNNFKSGRRCVECSGLKRKTLKEVKEYIESFKGYILLSEEYINSFAKLNVQCPSGHMFKINWANFTSGHRCPICKESKGERKIYEFFQKYNIKSERQYSYNNLTSDLGNPLKFDFAVLDDNNNVKFLVEYDGIFHYEKQYDDDGFETLQYHDSLKNEHCAKNNIPLLRIPYWEFDNIENILQKYLKLQIAS